MKFKIPKEQIYDKKIYEPILLDCINLIPFFIEKSGGGFIAPESEANGQCDAIGVNGTYGIDFKLLISEEGAQNVKEARLQEVTLCAGVTITQPSKASLHGKKQLPFPNVWGFLRSNSLCLNEHFEIELKEKSDKFMTRTIKRLNKIICTKKHLLFFNPLEFVDEYSYKNSIEILCSRAKGTLSIISEARARLSPGFETYYAILVNSSMIFLCSDGAFLGCNDLASSVAWRKIYV